MIEEQHVTHYESLLDPLDSWLKQLVFHEYNEVWNYWSMVQQETDPRIKSLWEQHLDMELGQLQVACQLLRRFEGVEPEEILPKELPEKPLTFQSNKAYVRNVLASQIGLSADGLKYVEGLTSRSRAYQDTVNAGGAPSELVVEMNREQRGHERRDETEGPHPVEELRTPAATRRAARHR